MENSLMPAYLLTFLLAGCLSYNLDGVPIFGDEQYEYRRDVDSEYVPQEDPASRSIEEYLLGHDQYEHRIRDSDIPYYHRQFDDDSNDEYQDPNNHDPNVVEEYNGDDDDDADTDDALILPSDLEDSSHQNDKGHADNKAEQDTHKKNSDIVNHHPVKDANNKIPKAKQRSQLKVDGKKKDAVEIKQKIPAKESNDKPRHKPQKIEAREDKSQISNVEYNKVESKDDQNGIKLDSVKSSGSTAKPPQSNNSAPSSRPRVGASHVKKVSNKKDNKKLDGYLFYVVVVACSVAGIAGLVLAGYCWYRLRKETDEANEAEYTTMKGGKGKKHKEKDLDANADANLTKSAEVYHYMHAKKQLSTLEQPGSGSRKGNIDSDSSDEESDNTVYECPGLAPPGDMRVVNPLFSDHEQASDQRSDGSYQSSPTRKKSGSRSSPPSSDPSRQ